jgi:hypothetical protein
MSYDNEDVEPWLVEEGIGYYDENDEFQFGADPREAETAAIMDEFKIAAAAWEADSSRHSTTKLGRAEEQHQQMRRGPKRKGGRRGPKRKGGRRGPKRKGGL